MLRILIADDHEVARKGIRALLESHVGWEVCGEARDGREAVECAIRLKPDVLLLDIGMPNLNGLDAARQILATMPRRADPDLDHTRFRTGGAGSAGRRSARLPAEIRRRP